MEGLEHGFKFIQFYWSTKFHTHQAFCALVLAFLVGKRPDEPDILHQRSRNMTFLPMSSPKMQPVHDGRFRRHVDIRSDGFSGVENVFLTANHGFKKMLYIIFYGTLSYVYCAFIIKFQGVSPQKVSPKMLKTSKSPAPPALHISMAAVYSEEVNTTSGARYQRVPTYSVRSHSSSSRSKPARPGCLFFGSADVCAVSDLFLVSKLLAILFFAGEQIERNITV